MKSFFRIVPEKRGARIRFFSGLLLLAAVLGIRVTPGAPATFRKAVFRLLPVPRPWELRLTGSPLERGRTHGREMCWAIRLLDKVYIRNFSPNETLNIHERAAERIFSGLDPEWREEIRGLAEGSGVEKSILMLGNSFLDMGLNASGCRQILVNAEGRVLHAHNLDWDNLGGVGNYLVTISRTETPGRLRTVHLGFPGMIGALDVINEKGIALSFNQLGLAPAGSEGKPVFIAMREIAERAETFEEAAAAIEGLPPGMPFLIGLSDAGNGKIAVFERDSQGGKILRRPAEKEGFAAADNSSRGFRAIREGTIDDLVRKAAPRTEKEIQALLRDPRILLGCNIYSLIFDFSNNRFYLASGSVPAALGEWRSFELFPERTL